ncbi:hypothetical protein V8C40DRAFT_242997 [Trichoderma camerunense]
MVVLFCLSWMCLIELLPSTSLAEAEGASLIISAKSFVTITEGYRALFKIREARSILISALLVKLYYVTEFKFASHSVRPYASDDITSHLPLVPLIRRWDLQTTIWGGEKRCSTLE